MQSISVITIHVLMGGDGIKHLRLVPYHPATNGQPESFVKALKHVLHRGQAVRSVQSQVDAFLHADCNSVHSTSQEMPAFHIYG